MHIYRQTSADMRLYNYADETGPDFNYHAYRFILSSFFP